MQFFKMEDFDCKCDRKDCDAVPMDMVTVMKLEGLRREFGEKMFVNSGTRCRYWNEKKNGSENSQHLLGKAVDIRCPNGGYLARLVMMAIRHGFTGIGVAKGFVHLDTRPGEVVMFGY